jgi:AcrR family transcriptional regulator
MSPRRSDPKTRTALIDIAARLLAAEGPQSLSTRRIAAEAGSSTMAVYTHFGGMSGLVREVVHEGFLRLADHFSRVKQTDDPVADMALLGRAYRHNALANAHLYVVMFGASSLAGFELTEEDRQHGRYTLVGVVETANRCIESGRFRPGDAGLVAHQMWLATHGLVTLELGEYLIEPWDADTCWEQQLVSLMAGAGDSLETATESVARSRERFPAEVAASSPEPAPVRTPSRIG